MKNKISLIIMLILVLFGICGCEWNKKKVKTDAILFKEEYESFNNKSNEYFDYRNISIDKNNPIVYTTDSEIVKKIENGETFIVYFGDPECPWCRSVIETAIDIANDNNIKKIYYVRIWDGFHNEKVRDTYKLDDNNKPYLESAGSAAYSKLIDYLAPVLSDYTLTTSNGKKVKVNEKRIMAPNFIFVKEGKAISMVDGISKFQKNYNDELTKEIIDDEIEILDKFFSDINICDSSC